MKPLKPIISPKIYFPGLISLLCLPLLCIGYLFEKGKLTQLYQMRVSYYNKPLIDELSKIQDKSPIYPDTFRRYKKITLSGDGDQNELYLKDVAEQFKRIKSSEDTVIGYQIQFSNNTKYADVVKTLDLFERDRYSYIIYNDDVYIFWIKPLATERITRSTTDMGLLFDDIRIVKPQPGFFEKLSIKFKDNITFLKPFWLCLIPLVGMIFFWRKRNKWGVG